MSKWSKTAARVKTKARGVAVAKVLVLRTCNSDMTSRHGFKWPTKGAVSAPDWDKGAFCGNGLHGLLWGEGEGGHLSFSTDAKWLVVEVASTDIVDLGGKVKFPRGRVVFCGDRSGATSFIAARRPGATICGGTATAGNSGTATAGYRGTATAGHNGTATAGDYGAAIAGHDGTATAGHYGTATAGNSGTATAGDYGTAIAGHDGTATAGHYGTATAGNSGTATAGDYGTAIAGDYGTAIAGHEGRLELVFYDGETDRYRKAIAYVGENGIKASTKYKLDDKHQFVEVTP